MQKSQLIILDRDGVINKDSDAFVKNEDEWIPIGGSIEAIARLSQNNYIVVVATNQSGLGRGLFGLDDLEAMHKKLNNLVEEKGGHIAGIFYCPHTPDDNCNCRKPKPGLIDAIERELDISATNAMMVGDSVRDLEAGITKECLPILVKTGKGLATLDRLKKENSPLLSQIKICDDLQSLTNDLLN